MGEGFVVSSADPAPLRGPGRRRPGWGCNLRNRRNLRIQQGALGAPFCGYLTTLEPPCHRGREEFPAGLGALREVGFWISEARVMASDPYRSRIASTVRANRFLDSAAFWNRWS